MLPVSQLHCAKYACGIWAHLFTPKINNYHGRRVRLSRAKKGTK
jgi:hypothetical protein